MGYITINKGGPMHWYPSTALPSVALIATLLGCAHRPAEQSDGAPTPPSTPQPRTVSTDEPARQGAASLEHILAGRISGVYVTPAPGGGIIVRMAGPTSFYAGQEPLYVVDGTPINVNHGTLSWISPHDVESITAVRGADATIYGVRGANGVIIIKTKGSH